MGLRVKEAALFVWLVVTFVIGTAVFSPLNGLALSVPTTWGLWALLMFREREQDAPLDSSASIEVSVATGAASSGASRLAATSRRFA